MKGVENEICELEKGTNQTGYILGGTFMNLKNKDMKKTIQSLEDGLTDLFQSNRYTEFLKTMTNFHGYSLYNIILIMMQCPQASLVAGYKKWQTMGRQVKKGEKAITILCPCPHKVKKKVLDKEGNPVLDENGKETEKEFSIPYFRPGNVFDISQTDGKSIETLDPKELTDSVDNYEAFIQKLLKISPVPVTFKEIEGSAKGYFSPIEKKIVAQKDMPHLQTLKTFVHESAHARLHNLEAMKDQEKDRETKEVEAESVAYCVLTAFGFDTSEYSFPYIAGWSSGRDMKKLKTSMDLIRVTAGQIIDGLQKGIEKAA